MIKQRWFLILLGVLGVSFAAMLAPVGLAGAQEPDGQADGPTVTLEPSATPALELTTAGWLETEALTPDSDISILAVTPIDCTVMPTPVVGFEISGGQDPTEVTDFLNDLVVNGFSVGTVDLTSGSIPACVDVLIVQGSVRAGNLTRSYSAADAALIQTWANGGHGVMISGEFDFFGVGTQELFLAYGYNQQGPGAVSDPTDADLPAPLPVNSWVIYQTDNFASHPILNGVNSLELLASSWLSPPANAIVTTDADATPATVPVMAAFTDGLGCVALTTDSNWNSVVGAVNGYFKQENAMVARQMVQWLNGCTSLKLTKVAAPSPAQAGGLLTYTLTAINDSAVPVTNVIITDTVPLSTSFVSASGPFAGPDVNGIVTWSLGTLNPNSSLIQTLVVRVDSLIPLGTVITNTAWVTSSTGLTDTATTFTPVNVQVVDPLVTKAVNTSQAQIGDVVTFTLSVSQTGQSNSNATNVQVVDPVSPEMDILDVQVNGGFTTMTGQIVTWTIPVLAPADVRLMTIQAQINSSTNPPLTLQNQAALSFDQGANRLSNRVEVLVPGLAPTATSTPTPSPTSPPPNNNNNDNDDDDDNNDPLPPTATPIPATVIAVAAPVATAILPVNFLPETGSWAASWPTLGWLMLGLTLLLIAMMIREYFSTRKIK